MTQSHIARRVKTHAAPDARITVADAVHEGKVPTDTHQHSGVEANVTIATIEELFLVTPNFPFPCARSIHGKNFHCQRGLLTRFHKVGDVDIVSHEHAVDGTEHDAVHPHLGVVVDTVELQPNLAAGKGCGHVKLGAEPACIEVAAHFIDIGYQFLLHLVIQAVIRFGKLTIVNICIQDSSRNNSRQPATHIVAHHRDGLGRVANLIQTLHFPYCRAVMAVFRIQPDAVSRALAILRKNTHHGHT